MVFLSTNFAINLENVAQISDIQNWEKKNSDALGNEKQNRLKRMESGEMWCVFSIVKSTNFAKTVESAAQISDIQNWEKKKP